MPRTFLTHNQLDDKIHCSGEPVGNKKAANAINIYKFPITIVIFILAFLAIVFVYYTLNGEKPDYNIAFLVEKPYTKDTISQLEGYIAQKGEDLNGDGKVIVKINQYVIPLDYERAQTISNLESGYNQNDDEFAKMSNISELSKDINSGKSMLYIVDDFSLKCQQEQLSIFSYTDGNIPHQGAVDYQNLGIRWPEFSYLMGLPLTTTVTDSNGNITKVNNKESFYGLYICMRDILSPGLDKDSKIKNYYDASLRLRDALM